MREIVCLPKHRLDQRTVECIAISNKNVGLVAKLNLHANAKYLFRSDLFDSIQR